jgi:hypothetical protein
VRLDEYIESLDTILEAPYSGWIGAMGRPDADYVGKAYKWQPQAQPKDFPYDRDDDGGALTAPRFSGTGQGRGQGKMRTLVRPLTAKGKGVTAKSGFEEASGTPMNFTQSGKGGQQLGNVAPGMGGDWAVNPKKKTDDDESFMDTLGSYNESAVDPLVPPVEEPAVLDPDHWEDSSDDELEKTIQHDQGEEPPSEEELTDFDSFPSVLMQVVGSGFGQGLGKTNPSGRGYMTGWSEDYDILANEGAWAALIKMLGME